MSADAVLISGACGGIGAATTERFLSGGHTVLGIDLREPDRVHARLRSALADVRDAGAMADAVENLTDGLELKHVVGLAGGVVPHEPELLETDATEAAEVFRASLELNLSGQFNLIRACLPRLRSAGGNRSITVCSSINALGDFGGAGYSAAKAGLIGMMHALAGPLGRDGIRINTIAPGTIRKPVFQAEGAATRDDRAYERFAADTHLKRVGEVGDVAASIEALADRMTHVTDQVLRVDGGQLLAKP